MDVENTLTSTDDIVDVDASPHNLGQPRLTKQTAVWFEDSKRPTLFACNKKLWLF